MTFVCPHVHVDFLATELSNWGLLTIVSYFSTTGYNARQI